MNLKGISPKLATSIPPTHPIYWMNLNYATTIKQDIDKLLAIGYPTHRKSYVVNTHCHSTKKNDEFIICVNFIKLNLVTKKNPYLHQ
jgi:hypothetical protein